MDLFAKKYMREITVDCPIKFQVNKRFKIRLSFYRMQAGIFCVPLFKQSNAKKYLFILKNLENIYFKVINARIVRDNFAVRSLFYVLLFLILYFGNSSI